jgi:hypothetical protein
MSSSSFCQPIAGATVAKAAVFPEGDNHKYDLARIGGIS